MKKLLLCLVFVLFLVGLVSATGYDVFCNVDSDCKLEVPSELLRCGPCDSYGCNSYHGWDDEVVAVNREWAPVCPNVSDYGNGTVCTDCMGKLSIDSYGAVCDDGICKKIFFGLLENETSGGNRTCSSKGELCGGIAGLLCCEGLRCKVDDSGAVTDISGVCIDDDKSDRVCCHKFGYGSQMKRVNSQYQFVEREDCVVPDDFVGGGREIVDDSFCGKKVRERLKKYYGNLTECPNNCTCAGSVMKCEGPNGRIMTVYAGGSGNMIVQIKNINMSTKVELYKDENGTLAGVFNGNKTKEIKILPDEVQDRIREKIQAKLEKYNITLDEDGAYLVKVKKKARLFFIIPVNENVDAEVDSESGEVIVIRKSWWGFLARDVKEKG